MTTSSAPVYSYTDAGRRLSIPIFTVPIHTPKIVHVTDLQTALDGLSVPIFTVPIHTPKIVHIDPADLQPALDVQIITPAQDTPVAMSPVPVNALKRVKTINRFDGLAIPAHRKCPAQEDPVIADQSLSLQRVKTINKPKGPAILARRKRPALHRVWKIVKSTGLAILGCLRTHSDGNSNELAESRAPSLKRGRNIKKLGGLDIIEQRQRRGAGRGVLRP